MIYLVSILFTQNGVFTFHSIQIFAVSIEILLKANY